MVSEDEDQDSENNSEFGSDEEDAEFALYASLYFEPNPDVISNNTNFKDGKESSSNSIPSKHLETPETVLASGNNSEILPPSLPKTVERSKLSNASPEHLEILPPEALSRSIKDDNDSVKMNESTSTVDACMDLSKQIEDGSVLSDICTGISSLPGISQEKLKDKQLENENKSSSFNDTEKIFETLEQTPGLVGTTSINIDAPKEIDDINEEQVKEDTGNSPMQNVNTCSSHDRTPNKEQRKNNNEEGMKDTSSSPDDRTSNMEQGINNNSCSSSSIQDKMISPNKSKTVSAVEGKRSNKKPEMNTCTTRSVTPTQDNIFLDNVGKRERLSSMCSEGSIPGNLPLDELYLDVSVVNDDVVEANLHDKLAVFNKDQEREFQETRKHTNTKRKRGEDDNIEADLRDRLTGFYKTREREFQGTRKNTDKKENSRLNEDSDDGLEDSRCDNLLRLKGKENAKISTRDEIPKSPSSPPSSENDLSDDIYILPPSPKQFDTIILSSNASDNEDVAIITSNKKIKTKTSTHKEKQVKQPMRTRSQAQKVTRESLSDIVRKINKPDDDTISLLSLDSANDNSSDSDFDKMDFSKANSTNLTLNVHKDLSQIINGLFSMENTTKPTIQSQKHDLPQQNTSRQSQKLLSLQNTSRKSTKQSKKSVSESSKPYFDYSRSRPDSIKMPSCTKWTQEMVNFYDSDYSDDFDVSAIHQQQSYSRDKWHINMDDRYGVRDKGRYYRLQERCRLCKQFDHKTSECTREERCHLCADTSHTMRHQCPQNCCFRCGGDYHSFCYNTAFSIVCDRCGIKGHISSLCPSLWRVYHLTTSGNVPKTHGSNVTKKRYCYMCGQAGHFGHECYNRFNTCPYPLISQEVLVNDIEEEDDDDISVVHPEEYNESKKSKPIIMKMKKRQMKAMKLSDTGTDYSFSDLLKEIEALTGTKVNIQKKRKKSSISIYGSQDAQGRAKAMLKMKLEELCSAYKDDKGDDIVLLSRRRSLNWNLSLKHNMIKKNKAYVVRKLMSFKDQLMQHPQFASKRDFKNRLRELQNHQKNILKNRNSAQGYTCMNWTTFKNLKQMLKKMSMSVAGNDEINAIDRFILEVKEFNGDRLSLKLCQSICDYCMNVFCPSLEQLDGILERIDVNKIYWRCEKGRNYKTNEENQDTKYKGEETIKEGLLQERGNDLFIEPESPIVESNLLNSVECGENKEDLDINSGQNSAIIQRDAKQNEIPMRNQAKDVINDGEVEIVCVKSPEKNPELVEELEGGKKNATKTITEKTKKRKRRKKNEKSFGVKKMKKGDNAEIEFMEEYGERDELFIVDVEGEKNERVGGGVEDFGVQKTEGTEVDVRNKTQRRKRNRHKIFKRPDRNAKKTKGDVDAMDIDKFMDYANKVYNRYENNVEGESNSKKKMKGRAKKNKKNTGSEKLKNVNNLREESNDLSCNTVKEKGKNDNNRRRRNQNRMMKWRAEKGHKTKSRYLDSEHGQSSRSANQHGQSTQLSNWPTHITNSTASTHPHH